MNFLELMSNFEEKFTGKAKFELLETRHSPYAFGSGFSSYRVKGIILRVVFDGKDNFIEVQKSKPHEKYPNCNWKILFSGTQNEFIQKNIDEFLENR